MAQKLNLKPGMSRSSSVVDELGELLDPVEEEVALLDGLGVLRLLVVHPYRLNDAPHLVDLAAQAAGADEARQLPVQEGRRDAEGRRHRVEGDAAIGLEELTVGHDADLAQEPATVRRNVRVWGVKGEKEG